VDVRATLLQVIADQAPKDHHSNLQSSSVLNAVGEKLSATRDHAIEQAMLAAFEVLFRKRFPDRLPLLIGRQQHTSTLPMITQLSVNL
jgi:hypothetical protein